MNKIVFQKKQFFVTESGFGVVFLVETGTKGIGILYAQDKCPIMQPCPVSQDTCPIMNQHPLMGEDRDLYTQDTCPIYIYIDAKRPLVHDRARVLGVWIAKHISIRPRL